MGGVDTIVRDYFEALKSGTSIELDIMHYANYPEIARRSLFYV